MDNIAGPPVRGDNFFNRDREVAELWALLDNHSLALLAPRRVGKTSILFRLCEQADERGKGAVYADVSGARNEQEVVQVLYAAIAEHHLGAGLLKAGKDVLKPFAGRLDKLSAFGVSVELGAADEVDYRAMGEAVLAVVGKGQGRGKDRGDQRDWVIMLDELPVFVLGLLRTDPTAARAREFLHWLRAMRTRYPRVRWIFAGSIGLTTVVDRVRLGKTIGDLLPFRDIGPFDRADARALLEVLAVRHDLAALDESVYEHLLNRLGWLLPFHLQLLFMKLKGRVRPGGPPPDASDVDAAYADLLAERTYFETWRYRLADSLGPVLARQAGRLLDCVARADDSAGAGATTEALRAAMWPEAHSLADGDAQVQEEREAQFGFLLDVLRTEGYLHSSDGRHRFLSPLLRDYWRQRLEP